MVLVIVALLFVFLMPVGSSMLNNQKRDLTRQRMKVADAAIANYVAINKRLPCPADGLATNGLELRAPAVAGYSVDCVFGPPNATSYQLTGVLPWATLGLSASEAIDGWNRKFTFRVAFGLTRDSALDMSACDSIGTAATTPADVNFAVASTVINTNLCNTALSCTGVGTTCTDPKKYLFNKGFRVLDGNGNVIADPSAYTGAAYVLISHAENAVGAYSFDNIFISNAAVAIEGVLEGDNFNNGRGVTSTDTTLTRVFRDAVTSYNETDANTYTDDLVVRSSVFSLIQRAQLAPRSH
jgi:type II secretory pathway pseudopilin PulG